MKRILITIIGITLFTVGFTTGSLYQQESDRHMCDHYITEKDSLLIVIDSVRADRDKKQEYLDFYLEKSLKMSQKYEK